MVIKKTQPNLFVLGRNFSDVTPKASSTLENFLAFPYYRFSAAVECPRKWVQVSYQRSKRL